MKYDNDHDVTNLLWTSSCRPPALQQTTYLTPSFSGPLVDRRGHFRSPCEYEWSQHNPKHFQLRSILIHIQSVIFILVSISSVIVLQPGSFEILDVFPLIFLTTIPSHHHKTGAQKNYSTAKHYSVHFSALKILKEIVPELTCGCGSDGLQHMTGCCGGELPLLSAEYN